MSLLSRPMPARNQRASRASSIAGSFALGMDLAWSIVGQSNSVTLMNVVVSPIASASHVFPTRKGHTARSASTWEGGGGRAGDDAR